MTLRRRAFSGLYRLVYMGGRALRDGGITILSYHSLDSLGTPLSVPPELFEQHMSVLAEEHCPTFTLSEVAAHLEVGSPFPPRAVAITFDDGFANLLDWGLPILQRYEHAATAYIITGMIGRTTRWTDGGAPLPNMPLLSWSQIERLHSEGVEIGAHSVTHGFLTTYPPNMLEAEMRESKRTLEDRFGLPVRSFAYPQGDYNRRVVDAARAAGYATAVTVDQGRAGLRSDPFRLPRLLVSGNTTETAMRAFTVSGIGPTYGLLNFVVKRVMGRRGWPRRKPGEVDSTGTVEAT